jgi:hypothetical protein
MTRRLLIVHPSRLRGENQGVYIQHVASLRWLLDGHDGWSVAALDPFHPAFAEAALESDVVVVHMLPHREIDALLRLRRARNLPTIFELSDNFLDLGDWLPKRHLFRSPLVRQNLLHYASRSDAVQVYAPGLAELFRHVNPNVIVFDPYVPIAEPRTAKPDGFVFGWGGTTSHEADLGRIAPAIVAFCAAHRDATFAFMGDAAMFARHFATIPADQTRVAPFGAYDAYLDFVRGLHVGLAPLRGSGFNAGRTDTKFATYAAAAVAPLLEDTPLHRMYADCARLFRDAEELRVALEELHADRAQCDALADRAYAWACRERSEARLRRQRVDAYRALLPEHPVADAPLVIDPAPAEAAQLVELSTQKRDAALATASDIARAHPGYTQAQWAVATTLEALARYDEALAHAERIEWPPLYAELAAELKARLVRRVRPADAARYLDAVASPLIRLRLSASPDGDRAAFFRAVLREQPYDYFALSVIIRLLQERDSESSELAELYARACLVSPEIVPRERRPAGLVPFLPT